MTLNGSDLTLASDSLFAGRIADAGTLKITGTFNFAGAMNGAMLDLANGRIDLTPPSTAQFIDLTMTDSTLTVTGPAQANSGPTVSVQDTLAIAGCSVLTVNGAPVAELAAIRAGAIQVTGGCAVVSGTGYIRSGVTQFGQAATLSPGQSPGILVFSGDLVLNNSVTTMELAGAAPGTGHDYIKVGGRFVIGKDAVLNLTSLGGYVPVAGQTFNLFDFDVNKSVGRFEKFTNGSDRSLVYSASTGVLLNLGAQTDTESEQLDRLAKLVSTKNDKTDTVVRSLLKQLLKPGSAANQFVGDMSGGNLIPALLAADADERKEIVTRFTPEGYGGLYEYGYRSLGFGPTVTSELDMSLGPKTAGNVSFSSSETVSSGSDTSSDFALGYTGISVTGIIQTEQYGFAFKASTVSGTANVDGVSNAKGSGQNLEFGAAALVRSTDNSSLQLYSTLRFASHELDGQRTSLSSVTGFSGVESNARELRIGAQYRWSRGNTTLSIDGALLGGTVGGLSFAEVGGDRNDRLTVSAPSATVTGGSLSVRTQTTVGERLRITGRIDLGVTQGLSDYSITGRLGSEGTTFETDVRGIDAVQANITLGTDYQLSAKAKVSASAYTNGLGGNNTDLGAQMKLDFEF